MGLFGGGTKVSNATSAAQSEGASLKSGSWGAGTSADWTYYAAVIGSGVLLWYAWKKAKNKRVK